MGRKHKRLENKRKLGNRGEKMKKIETEREQNVNANCKRKNKNKNVQGTCIRIFHNLLRHRAYLGGGGGGGAQTQTETTETATREITIRQELK